MAPQLLHLRALAGLLALPRGAAALAGVPQHDEPLLLLVQYLSPSAGGQAGARRRGQGSKTVPSGRQAGKPTS